MKKVFAVLNQARYHDSDYYGICGVFSTLEDAQGCLGTEEHDFLANLENLEKQGIGSEDFKTSRLVIEEEEQECTITDSKTGMFEKFTIEVTALYEKNNP